MSCQVKKDLHQDGKVINVFEIAITGEMRSRSFDFAKDIILSNKQYPKLTSKLMCP